MTFFFCVTADAANKIICSKDHLSTLVRCCDSSGHEGVKAEASRMLAMMAKQARTAGELGLGFGPQLFPRDKIRISVLPHTPAVLRTSNQNPNSIVRRKIKEIGVAN